MLDCVPMRSPAAGMAVVATRHVIRSRRERAHWHVAREQQHQAEQCRQETACLAGVLDARKHQLALSIHYPMPAGPAGWVCTPYT
jgi:hypothetical protein